MVSHIINITSFGYLFPAHSCISRQISTLWLFSFGKVLSHVSRSNNYTHCAFGAIKGSEMGSTMTIQVQKAFNILWTCIRLLIHIEFRRGQRLPATSFIEGDFGLFKRVKFVEMLFCCVFFTVRLWFHSSYTTLCAFGIFDFTFIENICQIYSFHTQ